MIPNCLLSLSHIDFREVLFPSCFFLHCETPVHINLVLHTFSKLQECEVTMYTFPVFQQNRNKGYLTMKFWEEAT